MRTFKSFDGEEIAFSDTGTGPSVVLVHGYLGDRRTWKQGGVTPALEAAGYRAVSLDLRGHGQSAKPHDPAAYRDEALARDVIALVDHLAIRRYALVGYSLGAIVTGTALGRDPRVSRAVMGGVGDWIMDPSWERPSRLADALLSGEAGPDDEEMVRWIAKYAADLGGDPAALAGVQIGHVPLPTERARRIAVPVLVLCGDGDGVNGDPAALTAAIPTARLAVVPGDHGTAFGTAEFLSALMAFLGEGSDAPGAADSRP